MYKHYFSVILKVHNKLLCYLFIEGPLHVVQLLLLPSTMEDTTNLILETKKVEVDSLRIL